MTYSFVVEPMAVLDFDSEDELIERCKEWNLLSGTATRVKTFQYKRQGLALPCEIVGYVDNQTVVIEFENKQRHCIHPAYLKEMQAAGFGQRSSAVADVKAEDSAELPVEAAGGADLTEEQQAEGIEHGDGGENVQAPEGAASVEGADSGEGNNTVERHNAVDSGSSAESGSSALSAAAPDIPQKKAASKKKAIQLPEDKLAVTATIKEFTTVPNHFSDNDDEVIIYEAVSIEGHDLAIDEVWSSHSATLKKLELNVGDNVSFEAKIVAKKLTQHPVKYKINNPSKMKKTGADS